MAGNGEKAIAVTVERRQKLKPETAIILYREKEDFYRSGNTQEVILFEITERGEFVKPKALDMRCMQDIFNSANGKAEMEFLDSRILAHNNPGVVVVGFLEIEINFITHLVMNHLENILQRAVFVGGENGNLLQ